MAGITSVSAAFSFSSVKADGQASDNVQDSTTNGDDILAQGSFFPALASAINSLSPQPPAELPSQADGAGQTCEDLLTVDTVALGDVQPVDSRSTLRVDVNNVPTLLGEAFLDMLAPMTSAEDSRQHGVFPSTRENISLQSKEVGTPEEGLSVPRQTFQTDENIPLSQVKQFSSASLTLGGQPTEPEEGEALQMFGEQLHSLQPPAELSDARDASILLLTHESDGRPQTRGEWLHTASSSAKPLEAHGTSISSLPPTSNGTPQVSGERLHTALSSATILDVHATPAAPIMTHNGGKTAQISDEPLRTTPSAAKLADAVASLNSPFAQSESGSKQKLRDSEVLKSPGVAPTLERSNPQTHEIPSGRVSNEQDPSRFPDRSTTAAGGIASSQSVNNRGAQRRVRDVFALTLPTVSSSAILGNGERAFLYQIGKEVTNGVERRISSEPPKGIEAAAPVQALEVHESGSLPELQPMIAVDQAAIPLAVKHGMQIEENSVRSQKQVTVSYPNSDATNSGEERVMPPATGSEAKARNSGNSGSSDSEVNERPPLRSVENIAAIESTKAGVAASNGRNEKTPGNPRMSVIEPERASTTSDAPATDSALRTSNTQIVEPLAAREHSSPIVQTSNTPMNVGTKPTGFMSQELGFDARTISSLVAENLTKGISNELVQRLRNGVSELKLQLKPESLGDMTLRVRLDDEKVVAQIHVTQPDVKVALEATVPQLRDVLASRGIEVQRVDIFAAGDAPTREPRSQQETRQRLFAKRRESDVAEERYRGARSMGYNTIEIVM